MSKKGTIDILLEEYCEGCPNKELELNSSILFCDGQMYICDEAAVCYNRKTCQRLFEYLKKKHEERTKPNVCTKCGKEIELDRDVCVDCYKEE